MKKLIIILFSTVLFGCAGKELRTSRADLQGCIKENSSIRTYLLQCSDSHRILRESLKRKKDENRVLVEKLESLTNYKLRKEFEAMNEDDFE